MTHDLQNICMSTITSYVKNNWCSELKDIFTQLDMNTFYEHKLVCDITLVKRKLFQWMKADWQSHVQNQPKLRTYRLFKADIDIESYIKYHMSKRKRSFTSTISIRNSTTTH